MKETSKFLAAMCAAATLCACSDFPKDPQNTTERAVGGTVRIGVADNPPWTDAGSEMGGVEVELVKMYAQAIGASPEWHSGGESVLLRKLQHFELDIVVAGLTADTPWKGRVATTPSYLTADTDGDGSEERHVLAAPPGENGWILRLDRFLHAHKQEALEFLADGIP